MLDANLFNLVKEQDFISKSALDIRPYAWGSLAVYHEEVRQRMSTYHSKYDLLHWLTFWTEEHRLNSPFSEEKKYKELKEQSRSVHQNVLSYLFSSDKLKNEPHAGYDIWNAIDGHIVRQHCPDVSVVLDFGSGYGRLGAIFGQGNDQGAYISVDCIEVSYILQNLFLSLMAPGRFHEYVDYAIEHKQLDLSADVENAVFHIPSWRLDLVPDGKVDLITTVFVLPEINEFALQDFVRHAKRVVKSGGYIYIRDHLYHSASDGHEGAHRLDTPALLEGAGFALVYQGDYEDNMDIYGIPRVYKKVK